jgi:hypothetical protein
MNLVTQFDKLIEDSIRLERDGSEWQLCETSAGATHTLLRIKGGQSLAFTLDMSGINLWPFIKGNTPLTGMRSVCDAIAAVQVGDKPVIVAIEMKSSKSGEASAKKQLCRAKLFIDWLMKLLEANGHWHGLYEFCGVISLKPRRQERKGTSGRTLLPSPIQHASGFKMFLLENHPKLDLVSLVSALA